jgi:glycosyltransferase involved in cell wall biosynthesis
VPRLTFDLRRVIEEVKPDLIHAGPIQTCAFLAVLSGFQPVLSMSWGYDLVMDAEKSAWMKWVTRYTLKHSAFFISDANVSREKAIAFGMAPDKTVIFPWGTDIEHFTPGTFQPAALRASKGSDLLTYTLFCNRAWEPIYGVDVLAKAFVKVAAEHPDIDLILLGGGSQGTKIRKLFISGSVLERVHFGGHVAQADLPRWYHMADLYISPSHVDGSSVSLMEALASGLPCLVSDIPGNREWIEDGVNGWLFRDGDADDLARKILSVSKHRHSLAQVRAAARKTAEQKADWQKNFGKLLEVYDHVMASRRPSHPGP